MENALWWAGEKLEADLLQYVETMVTWLSVQGVVLEGSMVEGTSGYW